PETERARTIDRRDLERRGRRDPRLDQGMYLPVGIEPGETQTVARRIGGERDEVPAPRVIERLDLRLFLDVDLPELLAVRFQQFRVELLNFPDIRGKEAR